MTFIELTFSEFIDNHQGVGAGSSKDGTHLREIQLKTTLWDGTCLSSTEAGINVIDNGYLGIVTRNEAADVGHVCDDTDLPCVTALATKVGSSDDVDPVVAVNIRVVGDERVVDEDFL
jgi:hypothetical protein